MKRGSKRVEVRGVAHLFEIAKKCGKLAPVAGGDGSLFGLCLATRFLDRAGLGRITKEYFLAQLFVYLGQDTL